MGPSISLSHGSSDKFIRLFEMECNQFKSVVLFVDSLVRSAHARRLAPVSSKSLTDFSICSILGLENNVTQTSTSSECHSDTSPPLSPYSDCSSPRPRHSETSPPLTPYTDISSSSSDCDSEPDQVPIPSEQSKRKKRQRTTFSSNEIWELERAFNRRPYLMSDDEEELVQKLGITAKSVKYWFQNRRAKSKKLERKVASVYQSIPPNQFGLPARRVAHSRRLQFVSQSPSDHWKQAQCISCPLVKDQPYSRPITPGSRHTSVNSNLLSAHQSFSLPMFHPDQFKIRPTEPARLPHNRFSHRFKPY